jgi:hypothetical protein
LGLQIDGFSGASPKIKSGMGKKQGSELSLISGEMHFPMPDICF